MLLAGGPASLRKERRSYKHRTHLNLQKKKCLPGGTSSPQVLGEAEKWRHSCWQGWLIGCVGSGNCDEGWAGSWVCVRIPIILYLRRVFIWKFDVLEIDTMTHSKPIVDLTCIYTCFSYKDQDTPVDTMVLLVPSILILERGRSGKAGRKPRQ